MSKHTVKIGVGSGWAGDRVDAVVDLVERVELDYLFFEALSESTVASAKERMLANPEFDGCDELIEWRFRPVLKTCIDKGIKILTNQGNANPEAGRDRIIAVARELGLKGLRVASVNSTDLGPRVLDVGDVNFDTGQRLDINPEDIVSVDPYMGADGAMQAFQAGADIVITSRISDNSLALAPLLDAFPHWHGNQQRMAVGCAVGHMLECGILGICGGFMHDPPRLVVPGFLEGIGLPYAVVSEDGDVVFEKVPDTGGFLASLGCRKKLMHEIGDAANYYDPNVTVDLAAMEFEDLEPNRVKMKNVRGKPRPEKLKVNISTREGYMTEVFAYYAGLRAMNRARAAGELLEYRCKARNLEIDEFRVEFPGIDSVFRSATPKLCTPEDPWEVCMRVTAKAKSKEPLLVMLNEFDANGPNGPFGTGKGIPAPERIRSVIGITSTLVPRDELEFDISIKES